MQGFFYFLSFVGNMDCFRGMGDIGPLIPLKSVIFAYLFVISLYRSLGQDGKKIPGCSLLFGKKLLPGEVLGYVSYWFQCISQCFPPPCYLYFLKLLFLFFLCQSKESKFWIPKDHSIHLCQLHAGVTQSLPTRLGYHV